MYNEQDFMKLLDILYQAVSATRSQPNPPQADEKLKDAEHLATKFLVHGASMLYLSRGTHVHDFPSVRLGFTDSASIDVIARAAFETFLVFHHIFVAQASAEERHYRYLSWKVAGLAERQHFPVATQEHQERLDVERRELHDLHNKLASNVFFQLEVHEEQKEKVLRGEWKLKSWREIAQSAGLTRVLSLDMYRYLCEYAHSGFVSASQIEQALHKSEQPHLIEPAMTTVAIAAANLIHGYCDLFPIAKQALAADAAGHEVVAKWVGIGRRL
jgi:hypothetical protein